MCGYLPESQYDTKTRQVVDDFYPKALQWCSPEDRPDNVISLDVSKCYPSILINNTKPIPIYTNHDIIEPFTLTLVSDAYFLRLTPNCWLMSLLVIWAENIVGWVMGLHADRWIRLRLYGQLD